MPARCHAAGGGGGSPPPPLRIFTPQEGERTAAAGAALGWQPRRPQARVQRPPPPKSLPLLSGGCSVRAPGLLPLVRTALHAHDARSWLTSWPAAAARQGDGQEMRERVSIPDTPKPRCPSVRLPAACPTNTTANSQGQQGSASPHRNLPTSWPRPCTRLQVVGTGVRVRSAACICTPSASCSHCASTPAGPACRPDQHASLLASPRAAQAVLRSGCRLVPAAPRRGHHQPRPSWQLPVSGLFPPRQPLLARQVQQPGKKRQVLQAHQW